MAQRDYEGDGIVVHWDSRVCMHSARCFGALPHVFRPSEQPWVRLDADGADAVAAAIDLCPSGALRYTRTDPRTDPHPAPADQLEENPAMTADPAPEPAAPTPAQLTVYPDGPNVLVGRVEIRNGAGELIKTVDRVALCRCGHSENKPFCDSSHKRFAFSDPGPSAPEAP